MASLPERPPVGLPPLPPGWTEHKAPTGHMYYYNAEIKKSTYVRPIAEPQSFPEPVAPPTPPPPPSYGTAAPNANFDLFNPFAAKPAAPDYNAHPELLNAQAHYEGPSRGHSGRGGFDARGERRPFQNRRRDPQDRPKHRHDIPDCTPWVLVQTKLKRRFVWNKDTNESFWKFPAHVMKGVVEFDRQQREKRERRERGETSDDEAAAAMAEMEAELADEEAQAQAQVVEVDGDVGMENDEEYEEVEVTDDEGQPEEHPSKRQRTEEPQDAPDDQGMELGEDDIAWQLAAMEGEYDEDEEEGLPLTEEDCKALFKELMDDLRLSPFTPWDKILEDDRLYEDDRYKALTNMKARKECFSEWARERVQILKELKANQQKLDPRIPYLSFLHGLATPKLYWPEFKRKYKKEPEMKDMKLPDKDKERLYRDHVKRLGMKSSELRSDLSALLKSQPLASLNRSTTLGTLPPSVLVDLRFISLPASTRDSIIEDFVSRLPPAPEGTGPSAEEEAETRKNRAERERRERALADRERKVHEDKRRQERDLAYGKGRLREEEMEIERAMKVGKDGLRGQLSGYDGGE
ncbi:hypothetical protein EJ04DRAFT_464131 [Polyplosphaeria fusca]|uniref:WW domain-containing protein n=1 Tax=Polyplosphaeria fusca TaxID=682080 RepID=A0A9P4R3Q9_9PLEO|nr:hypothetical protein EJ04DRAFT_464131 [Polyplosphaeria fusca]